MTSVPLVRAIRSGVVEAVHHGSVAVVDAGGDVVAWAGDPSLQTFARSSMKPLQAAVSASLVEDDLTDAEIAVICASHNGEPVHIEQVGRILARAGLGFDALQTPSMLPWDQASAIEAGRPDPRYSDCSGKHAGMLLACVRLGWETTTYREAEHPLQRRVLEAVLSATGLQSVAVGVDGCGVPVHGMPLAAMATIYARLTRPETLGDLGRSAGRAIEAMLAQPYLVAGRNRACTDLMEAAEGLAVKAGAEGLICAAMAGSRLGVAVKVEDGSARAAPPALVAALRALGVLPDPVPAALARWAAPPVLGGARAVGALEPVFELQRA